MDDDRVRRSPRRQLSQPDLQLLAFAAEHRLVLATHAQALLGTSAPGATRRLGALVRAGYLRSDRQLAVTRWYQIERTGLAVVGSRLSRPRDVDLATYEHDVGLAWLRLAADRGAFGATRKVVSEREMRSADRRAPRLQEPQGVRVAGAGPRGGDRRHYPDLLIETATGHRVAVELELSTKSPRRREGILGGYAIDARFDAVLYLVDRPSVGLAIERSAAAVGVGDMVHVQRVAFGAEAGGISSGRSAERAPPRPAMTSAGRAASPASGAERG